MHSTLSMATVIIVLYHYYLSFIIIIVPSSLLFQPPRAIGLANRPNKRAINAKLHVFALVDFCLLAECGASSVLGFGIG